MRARLIQPPAWTFVGRVIKPGVMLVVHLPEVDYPGDEDGDGSYYREIHTIVARVIFSLSAGVRLKVVKILEPADGKDTNIYPGRVMRFKYTIWKWDYLPPSHLLERSVQIAWATQHKEKTNGK